MKSNLRKNDIVRARFNNLALESVVQNNISLQSTSRALAKDFKISINNITADYFLGDKFKEKFASYSIEDKAKLCRLLASLRHKELLQLLEAKD